MNERKDEIVKIAAAELTDGLTLAGTPADTGGTVDHADADFLLPMLNQAIRRNLGDEVRRLVGLGAPVRGWVRTNKDNWNYPFTYSKDVEAPLRLAVEHADFDIVRFLIDSGAPTGHTGMSDRHNPALAAIDHNRPQVLAELLRHGAIFSERSGDDRALKESPVWRAAEWGRVETLRFLAGIPSFTEDFKILFGKDSTLASFVIRFGHRFGRHGYQDDDTTTTRERLCDVLTIIFAQGVAVDAIDGQGRTLLHVAAESFDDYPMRSELSEICGWLIEQGCDPAVKNNCGKLFHEMKWRPVTELESLKDLTEQSALRFKAAREAKSLIGTAVASLGRDVPEERPRRIAP